VLLLRREMEDITDWTVACASTISIKRRIGAPPSMPCSMPLPQGRFSRNLRTMEVHFGPDLQAKIDQLVSETGCTPDKLLEDALAGYVPELVQTREMLNSRYDDLKSGRAKPIPGDEVEASFREKSAAARRSQPGS
jgi:hypothetical protein